MGYTHNWKQSRDFTDGEWLKIQSAAIQLTGPLLPEHSASAGGYYSDSPLEIGDPWADRGAIVNTGNEIAFNGTGPNEDDLGHETFTIFREGPHSDFCKTARKPYDLIVTALLLVIKEIAPDAFFIESDGDVEDWMQGHQLATLVSI